MKEKNHLKPRGKKKREKKKVTAASTQGKKIP